MVQANRSWAIFLIIIGFGVGIHNEFADFFFVRQESWKIPATFWDNDNVRILLVADPQIQGYKDEPNWLGIITRWDADLYLQRHFAVAMNKVKPDIVFFLGDLIDEGSKASNSDFETYAKRFQRLFPVQKGTKTVYLAGDNDIGGEGNDYITREKIARFEKHFGRTTELIHYRHISFSKINMLEYIPTGIGKSSEFEAILKDHYKRTKWSSVRILLTHTGLSMLPMEQQILALEALKPRFAFTAHTHLNGYSQYSVQELIYRKRGLYDAAHLPTTDENQPIMEEYRIPTCSYRMGVPKMAYAAVAIDSKGKLGYHLLWLPSRFKHLYIYVVYITFAITVAVLRSMRLCRYNYRTIQIKCDRILQNPTIV